MNARIFYLPNQRDLIYDVQALLREHLYQSIQVSHLEILDSDREAARSYLTLLRASMIKSDNFRIGIEEADQYVWYLGYEEDTNWKSLKLRRSSMSSIFPAIAIMDRMVVLPRGIYDAFDTTIPFFPKPLDLQGVLLLDFNDKRAIAEAIRQVGVQVKDEVAKLCKRYIFIKKVIQPNFKELAELLKIDKEYLEQNKTEMFAASVKLTPRIVSGPAQLGRSTLVSLEITNESEFELGVVRTQVKAPVGSLKTPVVREYLDFSIGKPPVQKIQFEVTPRTSPYCPLELLFEPNEPSQIYTPFPIPIILDVMRK
ncbi:MAG TPA: hypothetical protein VJU84_04490 [Pyrinomonadaceae bacterium]|nr:hypothetical protein [Pyrinomonadaceae bacterium]